MVQFNDVFRGEVIFTKQEINFCKISFFELIQVHLRIVEDENGLLPKSLGWYHQEKVKEGPKVYFSQASAKKFIEFHRQFLQKRSKELQ